MSNFKYACFISYRNGTRLNNDRENTLTVFARQLKEALSYELDMHMTFDLPDHDHVFLDQDSLAPGAFIHSTFSKAICKSICMIVVYTPSYFPSRGNKLFCASEFMGMIAREKERFERLGIEFPDKGCIIPVCLRGNLSDMPNVLKSRISFDFNGFNQGLTHLSENSLFQTKVRQMAEYIAEHCSLVDQKSDQLGIDLCDNCPTFQIPDISTSAGIQEVNAYISEIKVRSSGQRFPLTGS